MTETIIEPFNFKRAYDRICNGEYEEHRKRVKHYDCLVEEHVNALRADIEKKTKEIELREKLLNAVNKARTKLDEGNAWLVTEGIAFTPETYPLIIEMVEELLKEYPSIEDFLYVLNYNDKDEKERRIPWMGFVKNPLPAGTVFFLDVTNPRKEQKEVVEAAVPQKEEKKED